MKPMPLPRTRPKPSLLVARADDASERDVCVTAVHEAGHVVAYVRSGIPLADATVRSVTFHMSGVVRPSLRSMERNDTEALLILSGYAAECMVCDDTAEWIAEIATDADDFRKYRGFFNGLERLDEHWTMAVNFVAQPENWLAIMRVASALLRTGTVDGDRLVALVQKRGGMATCAGLRARANWILENGDAYCCLSQIIALAEIEASRMRDEMKIS